MYWSTIRYSIFDISRGTNICCRALLQCIHISYSSLKLCVEHFDCINISHVTFIPTSDSSGPRNTLQRTATHTHVTGALRSHFRQQRPVLVSQTRTVCTLTHVSVHICKVLFVGRIRFVWSGNNKLPDKLSGHFWAKEPFKHRGILQKRPGNVSWQLLKSEWLPPHSFLTGDLRKEMHVYGKSPVKETYLLSFFDRAYLYDCRAVAAP